MAPSSLSSRPPGDARWSDLSTSRDAERCSGRARPNRQSLRRAKGRHTGDSSCQEHVDRDDEWPTRLSVMTVCTRKPAATCLIVRERTLGRPWFIRRCSIVVAMGTSSFRSRNTVCLERGLSDGIPRQVWKLAGPRFRSWPCQDDVGSPSVARTLPGSRGKRDRLVWPQTAKGTEHSFRRPSPSAETPRRPRLVGTPGSREGSPAIASAPTRSSDHPLTRPPEVTSRHLPHGEPRERGQEHGLGESHRRVPPHSISPTNRRPVRVRASRERLGQAGAAI
jgi:hypothetical protein